MAFSFVNAFLSIVKTFAAYYILVLIYRLVFHPLARFPGPTPAALSSWYEFYFDVVKRGRFLWEIEKMHEEYGENLSSGHQCPADSRKVLSSASTRMSFISTTQNFMMSSTALQLANVTNTPAG